jgi:hypothetical protein
VSVDRRRLFICGAAARWRTLRFLDRADEADELERLAT